MTAQIQDQFIYNGTVFCISGISYSDDSLSCSISTTLQPKLKIRDIYPNAPFSPLDLGLKPAIATTACWRGYQAFFNITKSNLVLENLFIKLIGEDADGYRPEKGPTINGIKPIMKIKGFSDFNNHYYEVNYHTKYTGGLILTSNEIDEPKFPFNLIYNPAWNYQKVIELIFVKGLLINEFDHSERMNEIQEMSMHYFNDHDEIDQSVFKEEIDNLVNSSFTCLYHNTSHGGWGDNRPTKHDITIKLPSYRTSE